MIANMQLTPKRSLKDRLASGSRAVLTIGGIVTLLAIAGVVYVAVALGRAYVRDREETKRGVEGLTLFGHFKAYLLHPIHSSVVQGVTKVLAMEPIAPQK